MELSLDVLGNVILDKNLGEFECEFTDAVDEYTLLLCFRDSDSTMYDIYVELKEDLSVSKDIYFITNHEYNKASDTDSDQYLIDNIYSVLEQSKQAYEYERKAYTVMFDGAIQGLNRHITLTKEVYEEDGISENTLTSTQLHALKDIAQSLYYNLEADK